MARWSLRTALVLVLVAGFALPVRAKLDAQRALIAENEQAIAAARVHLASLPTRAELERGRERAEKNLAIIQKLARDQRQYTKLVDHVVKTAAESDVELMRFSSYGGRVELCGVTKDNANISEYLRALQKSRGVSNVSLAFIERDWDQWCYDFAHDDEYGFVARMTLDGADEH